MKRLFFALAFAGLAICGQARGFDAMTESEIVAATLWYEARGEGKDGIDAVASVIQNRADRSGRSLSDECLRRKQFSCWNDRLPTETPSEASGEVWEYCLEVAKRMASGAFVATIAATHYYNPSISRPSWGSGMTQVVTIGRHRFGIA